MKKITRVLSFLIVLSLIISPFSETAKAQTSQSTKNQTLSGNRIPTEDEYMEYFNGLSKDQQNDLLSRKKDAINIFKHKNTQTRSSSVLPGSFVMYQQVNDYWCGPATLQAMIRYINGTSVSQNQIASWLGVSPTSGIVTWDFTYYLNYFQNQHYYYFVSSNSKNELMGLITNDISSYHVPTGLLIDADSGSGWQYTTPNGHFLASHWINTYYERVGLADPLGGRLSWVSTYYDEPANIVQNVCSLVIC